MDWLIAHWDTLAAAAAFLVAGFKAWKRKETVAFLVSKVEGLATPEERKAIGADAVKAKVEGTLAPIVKKITKGESGGILGAVKGLVLPVLLGFVLTGCAAADAGKASTSVTVNLSGPFGDTATVTISSTVTPTSTATQTPENTVSTTATIPAGGLPK